MILAQIVSVNVGQTRIQGGSGRAYPTAIAKTPCSGSVAVDPLGLQGDQQADRTHHGGPDQAVHAHFTRHLATWSELRGTPLLPGEIGENLTLADADEGSFCIGDIVQAGTAKLQVTQPRVPCYKQADRLGIPHAVAMAKQTGRTGLYFRVLESGAVAAGDRVRLLERPHPEISVAFVNHVLHVDHGQAARVAACPELGARLRPAVT